MPHRRSPGRASETCDASAQLVDVDIRPALAPHGGDSHTGLAAHRGQEPRFGRVRGIGREGVERERVGHLKNAVYFGPYDRQDALAGLVCPHKCQRYFFRANTLTMLPARIKTLPMTNVVSALRQELATLEADLSADPRYRKIERIRALLAEYEADVGANETDILSANVAPRRKERTRPLNSKTERVREIIKSVLIERGTVHRSELLKVLTGKGIMGSEKDPMASLAAYLSDFKDDFRNVGTGQWALAIPPKTEAPVSEPTEAS